MESCAYYHSNVWCKLPGKKKNTHLPSNLTFTTGSSLVIRIISFFMVRSAGHILLNQFYILKDTKWGCKAAGTRTNTDFHVSASATYLSLQFQNANVCSETGRSFVPCKQWGSSTTKTHSFTDQMGWESSILSACTVLHPTSQELNQVWLPHVTQTMRIPVIYTQTLYLPSPLLALLYTSLYTQQESANCAE